MRIRKESSILKKIINDQTKLYKKNKKNYNQDCVKALH